MQGVTNHRAEQLKWATFERYPGKSCRKSINDRIDGKMTLAEFVREAGITPAEELEKVRLLAFYFHETASQAEFTVGDVATWLVDLNMAAPNRSRLRGKLATSRKFVRGTGANSFRVHAGEIHNLRETFPTLSTPSEDVISKETILPATLYGNTRGFIESLAKQVNAAFEHNIHDGCAVLMRRLGEVLFILSYEHHGIEATIQDGNENYVMLERIIADAKGNKTLRLSRNSKAFVDEFRTLGNFAAHKIYFTTRRSDIQNIAAEYRALVEELLYKAGIRT